MCVTLQICVPSDVCIRQMGPQACVVLAALGLSLLSGLHTGIVPSRVLCGQNVTLRSSLSKDETRNRCILAHKRSTDGQVSSIIEFQQKDNPVYNAYRCDACDDESSCSNCTDCITLTNVTKDRHDGKYLIEDGVHFEVIEEITELVIYNYWDCNSCGLPNQLDDDLSLTVQTNRSAESPQKFFYNASGAISEEPISLVNVTEDINITVTRGTNAPPISLIGYGDNIQSCDGKIRTCSVVARVQPSAYEVRVDWGVQGINEDMTVVELIPAPTWSPNDAEVIGPGAILGIVVVVILVVSTAIGFIVLCVVNLKKRQRQKRKKTDDQTNKGEDFDHVDTRQGDVPPQEETTLISETICKVVPDRQPPRNVKLEHDKNAFKGIVEQGHQMACDGHFDSAGILKDVQDFDRRHNALKNLISSRRQKLEDSLRWHQFVFDADGELSWIKEHMPAATSQEYGKNLVDAKNLGANHKKFEQELQGHQPTKDKVQATGDALVKAQHFASGPIRDKDRELSKAWDELLYNSGDRKNKLDQSLQKHKVTKILEDMVKTADELIDDLHKKKDRVTITDFIEDKREEYTRVHNEYQTKVPFLPTLRLVVLCRAYKDLKQHDDAFAVIQHLQLAPAIGTLSDGVLSKLAPAEREETPAEREETPAEREETPGKRLSRLVIEHVTGADGLCAPEVLWFTIHWWEGVRKPDKFTELTSSCCQKPLIYEESGRNILSSEDKLYEELSKELQKGITEMSDWIKRFIMPSWQRDPMFIRALVRAVCSKWQAGSVGDDELVQFLGQYIPNAEDAQVNVLLAIQECPKTEELVTLLFKKYFITKQAVCAWSKDPRQTMYEDACRIARTIEKRTSEPSQNDEAEITSYCNKLDVLNGLQSQSTSPDTNSLKKIFEVKTVTWEDFVRWTNQRRDTQAGRSDLENIMLSDDGLCKSWKQALQALKNYLKDKVDNNIIIDRVNKSVPQSWLSEKDLIKKLCYGVLKTCTSEDNRGVFDLSLLHQRVPLFWHFLKHNDQNEKKALESMDRWLSKSKWSLWTPRIVQTLLWGNAVSAKSVCDYIKNDDTKFEDYKYDQQLNNFLAGKFKNQ